MSIIESIKSYFKTDRDEFVVEEIDSKDATNNDLYDISLDPSHSNSVEIKNNIIKSFSQDADEMFIGSWGREKIEETADEYRITEEDDTLEWRQKYNNSKIWLGYKVKRETTGEPEGIGIDLDKLETHGAVFGKTGVGKTTLLRIIAYQIINLGYGLAYITPKDGEEDLGALLRAIPKHRREDVVSIRYRDKDTFVPSLNYLESVNDKTDKQMKTEHTFIKDTGVAIGQAQDSWGDSSIIQSVFDGYIAPMAISDEPFTPTDVRELLLDQDKREKFAEYVESEIDTLNDSYNYATDAKTLAETDTDNLEASQRRFQKWNDPSLYDMIKNKESTIDFNDILSNQKILLVDASGNSEDFQQALTIIVIRKLWKAAKRRARLKEEKERKPFYTIVDEFDSVVTRNNYKALDIKTIISEARSYGFHLIAASQYPSQIPSEVTSEFYGNMDMIISMNVGESSDQNALSQQFSRVGDIDVSAKDIGALDKYEFFIQRDKEEQPLRVQSFPDYPYRISNRKMKNIFNERQKEYGYDRTKPTQQSILTDVFGRVGTNMKAKTEDGITNEQELFLDLVLIGQYYTATQEGNYNYQIEENKWVSLNILEEIVDVVDEINISDLSHWINSESYGISKNNTHNGLQIKLDRSGGDSSGYEIAKRVDSGSSGSAGRSGHRFSLPDIQREFAKLGIAVTIPKQGEGELPDAIGYNFAHTDYQEELFGRENEYKMNIEAEHSTLKTKKGQTLTNLRKAAESGVNCVFVVEDSPKSLIENAKQADFLTNGGIKKEKADGSYLYNMNQELYKEPTPNNIEYPVRKRNGTTKESIWFEDNGTYMIKDNEGVIHAEFTREEMATGNWDMNQFKYYYEKTENSYVVRKTDDGKSVARYNTLSDMKDEFMTFKKPFAPKAEMPGSRRIDSDDYSVVIIEKSGKPHLYDVKTGETTPLYNQSNNNNTTNTNNSNTDDRNNNNDTNIEDKGGNKDEDNTTSLSNRLEDLDL